ncbi:DUF2752 domain-containing protein [Marinicrinis sediminis]|uniref:DUF2752 domain-containing protein n=1 Tax=Marinicrinis sediminis TaxID=1652465 RepID=A0ABW5REL4_9BACL
MLTKWFNTRLLDEYRSKLLWGTGLGLGAMVYLKVWLPVTNIGVPCVFHSLTGLDCPGCGMTRASLALLNGDLYQVFRFNPLIFFIAPLYIAFLIASKMQKRQLSQWLIVIMVISALAFGILRNVPFFDWLAPTVVS